MTTTWHQVKEQKNAAPNEVEGGNDYGHREDTGKRAQQHRHPHRVRYLLHQPHAHACRSLQTPQHWCQNQTPKWPTVHTHGRKIGSTVVFM